MSKRVLVISSSPRKGGNSDQLCDAFLKGASEAGHHTDKVFLRSKTINYCTGCGNCIDTGKCVQKDDMADILALMTAADVIMMATPVYFYTMCAQMKTLIDRTVAGYRQISNKQFYFIMTAADSKLPELERTIEAFRSFTMCLNGAEERGVLYGTGAWNIGDLTEAVKTEAYNMGKQA